LRGLGICIKAVPLVKCEQFGFTLHHVQTANGPQGIL
jgi:hypothetical protein